jgi:hypothetical protein
MSLHFIALIIVEEFFLVKAYGGFAFGIDHPKLKG